MTHPTARRAAAVAFPPEVRPDWDHARTRRLALRAPEAEWCASSVSEPLPDGFWAPRADFSYEGLLCLVNRENWKFLDRLAFQVREGGTILEVVPGEVQATPEQVTYTYAVGTATLAVTYTLVDAPPQGIAGLVVDYAFEPGAPAGLTLHLKPILDIRHMYQPSDPARHRVNPVDAQHLTIVNTNHWLGLRTSRPFSFVPGREQRDLVYHLGRGERQGEGGEARFKPETYRVFAPGELSFAAEGLLRVTLQAGLSEKVLLESLRALEAAAPELIAGQVARLDGYAERLPRLSAEAVHRVYVMAEKFGMPVDAAGGRLPESGAWWFRTPWFRNVFEGYLHNWRTLRFLGKQDTIEAAMYLVLKFQEPGLGRLPNRLPEQAADQERWEKTGSLPAEYYAASDATTLLFTLLDEMWEHMTDEALLAALWAGFQVAFKSFKGSRLTQRHGTPVLLENGLLLVVPGHSWTNGRRVVWAEGMTVTDLPIRCPVNWQIQDVLHFRDTHYAWEQYQYPTYYLPEINAQWLRMLRVGAKLAERFGDADAREELAQIGELAKASYKAVFWNPHANNLYNLVTLDRRIDGTPGSPAVEAAALLGETMFTRQELEYIWLVARNRLLVKRRPAPGEAPVAFGLLVKDSPERIFYDNQQYHEAVCWPRETPYLIRLLHDLGQEATVQELLRTNLAHQTEEGVLFYNNEILSLAEGLNPAPDAATEGDPVPVKNPMQWWSQWCDAYLPADLGG